MTLPMFDVSSVNHPGDVAINWKKVAKAGYKGVMIKAGEGTLDEGKYYLNPWLEADARGARSVDLSVGYYWFAHPATSSPVAQAEAFIAQIKDLPRNLGLALDLEVEELDWAQTAEWGKEFLARLAQMPKTTTILYSNYNFLTNMPGSPWGHKLWLASPSSIPRRACWMWQKAPRAISGIDGGVDIDAYFG